MPAQNGLTLEQLQRIVKQLSPQQVQMLLGSQAIPPGALVQYYNDLASGVLAPEDMRIENLQFRVQIDPAGNIVSQTDAITLVSRYSFVFRRVVGFLMDPDFAGSAPALVNFQVRENGRNFEIFKRPVSMQAILPRAGSNVMEWDGVYTTVPGTDIDVLWSVDTARWAALVGASKEFGVQLLGDYVACAPR
jgi:hypothetical protein